MSRTGDAAIEAALAELRAGAHAQPYGMPNTSKYVRKYLAPCVRDGKRLGLTVGNWCAAFACWCAFQRLPKTQVPHGYRAGVVELVADAKELGKWFPLEALLDGWEPQPGDLAIWDRSDPGRPETSWWRHVNRVMSYDVNNLKTVNDDEFQTIGGNEARRVRITQRRPKRLGKGRLLGFISYDIEGETNTETFTDYEREQLRELTEAMHAELTRKAMREIYRDSLKTNEPVEVTVS